MTPRKFPLTALTLVLAIIALVLSSMSLLRDKKGNTGLEDLTKTVVTLSANMVHRQDHFQKEIFLMKANMPLQAQKTFAEVSYLIDIANIQLTVNYDAPSALKTLQSAQNLLAASHDARFMALSAAMQTDRDALSKIPASSQSQVFTDISNLIQKIQSASLLPKAEQIAIDTTVPENDASKPWYKKLGVVLLQLKSLIVIRHVNQNNPPLVAPNMENNLKQNLIDQLIMAQWAVLHHDQAIYTQAIQNALAWTNLYFSMATEKEAFSSALSQLSTVSVVPILPLLSNTMTALAAVNLQQPSTDQTSQSAAGV